MPINEELHQLRTDVELTKQCLSSMQKDVSRINKTLDWHILEKRKTDETFITTLTRIELKLARWQGVVLGGYMILLVVWGVIKVLTE